MPLYPFILLVGILLAVVLVPPLVAAYLDHRREMRAGGSLPAEGGAAAHGPERHEDRSTRRND